MFLEVPHRVFAMPISHDKLPVDPTFTSANVEFQPQGAIPGAALAQPLEIAKSRPRPASANNIDLTDTMTDSPTSRTTFQQNTSYPAILGLVVKVQGPLEWEYRNRGIDMRRWRKKEKCYLGILRNSEEKSIPGSFLDRPSNCVKQLPGKR